MSCVFCGNPMVEKDSHNPNPVYDSGRCCMDCNKKML